MKRALLVLLMALPLLVAQEAVAPEYRPSPAQADKLEIALLKFQNAAQKEQLIQQALQKATADREESRKALVATCGQVIAENKWLGVECRAAGGTIEFVKAAKPEAKQ